MDALEAIMTRQSIRSYTGGYFAANAAANCVCRYAGAFGACLCKLEISYHNRPGDHARDYPL